VNGFEHPEKTAKGFSRLMEEQTYAANRPWKKDICMESRNKETRQAFRQMNCGRPRAEISPES
jgi:RNA-splicing ligase RtcB